MITWYFCLGKPVLCGFKFKTLFFRDFNEFFFLKIRSELDERNKFPRKLEISIRIHKLAKKKEFSNKKATDYYIGIVLIGKNDIEISPTYGLSLFLIMFSFTLELFVCKNQDLKYHVERKSNLDNVRCNHIDFHGSNHVVQN